MANFDYQQFAIGYRSFDCDTWSRLSSLYHIDARFVDPIHDIRGHGAIEAYFTDMASGLDACEFALQSPLVTDQSVVVAWQMVYRHKRLNGGRDTAVDGITQLTLDANGLITLHRDYYDMGQMVYERIPLLGAVVRYLRGRLAGANKPHRAVDRGRKARVATSE